MAVTTTFPAKAAAAARGNGSPRAGQATDYNLEARAGQGSISFGLLLLFTFFLLARPQDFIGVLRPIPIAMIVGVGAMITYAASVFMGRLRFQLPIELQIVFALTIWFILGVPFSYWRGNSVDLLKDEWLKTLIIFVLITQTLITLSRLRKLLWVIFLSGLVATGLSLALGGNFMADDNSRFMGLTRGFFSGNYLGIAAAVTLPYMAAMLIHTRSVIKSLMLLGTFGTMMSMAVFTASRGNIISIVVSLMLVWVMLFRESMKARMFGMLFGLGIVLAVAAAPGVFWARVGTLWNTESIATSKNELSADQSEFQRKRLLIDSINYTLQHPIFGLGLGNFAIAHGTDSHNAQEWKGTHNTFTQVSSEGGIPALGLFLALLIVSLRSMWRLSRECEGKPELAQMRALSRATIVSIVSFMLGGFFAHLAYEMYVYYLAGISVGLQAVMEASQSSTNDKSSENSLRRPFLSRKTQEARP